MMEFKKETSKQTLLTIISMLFVVLFVYAATSKLLDFETFKLQIGETSIFKVYAAVIACSLIFLQLLTAALLLFQCTRRLGLYLSFILMTFFTLYIIIVLNFSSSIPCACSGIIPGMGWHTHLFFNTALTLIAFFGIILEKKQAQAPIQDTT